MHLYKLKWFPFLVVSSRVFHATCDFHACEISKKFPGCRKDVCTEVSTLYRPPNKREASLYPFKDFPEDLCLEEYQVGSPTFWMIAKAQTHGLLNKKQPSLTTVIVNNNGGGIFSFLPHGKNVGFKEFFRTPMQSFSLAQGTIQAFGVQFHSACSYLKFCQEDKEAFAIQWTQNSGSTCGWKNYKCGCTLLHYKECWVPYHWSS